MISSLKQIVLCIIKRKSLDIVEFSIPLLLSKAVMKKAGTFVNFKEDMVSLLGKNIMLNTSESGHYYMSIIKYHGNNVDVLFIKQI